MKILQIGKYYYPYKGGIENNTKHCCDSLKNDFEVECLVFNTENKTVHEYIEDVKITRASSLGNFSSQEISLSFLIEFLKSKPDIIHFHAPNPLVSLYLLLFHRNIPLVITHHTDISDDKKFRTVALWIYKKLLKRAVGIISYTNAYASSSDELKGFENKFVIIPNGTVEQPFVTTSESIAESLQLKKETCDNQFTLFFIGRHVAYKGVEIILKALIQLPDVHLLIAGAGPETTSYELFVSQNNLNSRVHFLGELNNSQKNIAYQACDAVVLPCLNRTESFGQILVEAQLSSKPTIVSNIDTGVREVVTSETGCFCEIGNVDSFKKAIHLLKTDEELRLRLGRNGYQRAKKYYVESVTSIRLNQYFKTISNLEQKNDR